MQRTAVVYEDAEVIAVLDQGASVPGQIRVIPRARVRQLLDLPPRRVSHLVHVAVLLSMALRTVTAAERLMLIQVVPAGSISDDQRFHLILTPYRDDQEHRAWMTIRPGEHDATDEVRPIVVLLEQHMHNPPP